MNNKNKYIALIIGAVVVLCCLGGVAVAALGGLALNQVSQAITLDPEKVAEIGNQMLDYEVPSGYREVMAMDLVGTRMVVIGPASGGQGMVLMLMQVPASSSNISDEELRQQMEDALAQQQGNSAQYDFKTVEEQEVEVNGKTVKLLVREGEDSNGRKMRQVTGVLDGKASPVMLMAMGRPTDWDQDALDEFLGSIR